MSWYVWTGMTVFAMLIYGFMALMSERIWFNYELALMILLFMFMFETVASCIAIIFNLTKKKE